MLREINFDGIVGPTHNYAGLSLGNLASARNAGRISRPRAAALQGLAKMRANLALGLAQGILLPHVRPHRHWLQTLSADMHTPPPVPAWAMSAAAMWTANAATVSPAPDTADGRCHLTVANLVTMPHRSHEWPGTLAQLRIAFSDPAHFTVHDPVPAPFGDEGAANHMRFASGYDAPGVEVFVFGDRGGPFPARQSRVGSEAVARRHGLDPSRTLMVRQSEAAIAAGAFHNDVVAVADGRTLFAHEQAFEDRAGTLDAIAALVPGFELVEVPAAEVSLADAIRSYLFNAQLVTLPDCSQALILPTDAREVPSVAGWVERNLSGNGPIRRVHYVDVRESMANGGGPACLRLRVVADPATVDRRFLVDDARIAMIEGVVARHWPEEIGPAEIASPHLIDRVEGARAALMTALDLDL
ncbi:succinylarginine dihydrolase [Sphingomonas jejuensis]|uniref:Succinylarginine dihydrolase n=1 Tax=Sphingomonas jejuensis TaxID=904715 RepID=A0ABX0XLH3_9SPHN|nr:N-succinylarginine dihydrolase [Sphingomonas jejuensis]NJC33616.1 succinylarginine dihydrolase [Sphingomonas jejuensis]